MKKNSSTYVSGSLALQEIPIVKECSFISFDDYAASPRRFRGKHARQPLFDWMHLSLANDSLRGAAYDKASAREAVVTTAVFMATALCFVFFGA